MLAELPVVRSAQARQAFIAALLIGAALVGVILGLRHAELRGLSAVFAILFTLLDYAPAVVMLGVLVAAAFVPTRASLDKLLDTLGAAALPVAGFVTVLFAAATLTVYRNHPLSMDEYAPFLQSQAFAAGRLTGQYPLPLLDWLIPFSEQNNFISVSRDTGAVASNYWPGFALLLTPFTLAGIPWLCNPVLSGLTVLALHRLTVRLTGDRRCAGLAVLLTIASPAFFANGISYYSMTAHMLANIVFVTLVLEPTTRRLVLAGFVGSFALVLHNPVPHLLFALPWLLWLVTRAGGARRILPLAAGYLPLSLVLGVGWFWYSHVHMHSGPNDAAVAALRAGQASLTGMFGLPNEWTLLARFIGLAKVWLWAVPGLMVFAAIGAWRHRMDANVRLLLASAALTYLGYFCVLVDQGHGWGYRYFHSAWFVLPVLAAFAVRPAVAAAATGGAPADASPADPSPADPSPAGTSRTDPTPPGDPHLGLRALIVACALLYLPAGLVHRASTVHGFLSFQLDQQPQYRGSESRVVFIDVAHMFYGTDLLQNDAFLRGDVVRLAPRGPEANAALMKEVLPNYRRVLSAQGGEVWTAGPSP